MKRFDPGTFGAPHHPHRHQRIRAVLSLVAATAGAVAVLVLGYIILGDEAAWAWFALPALVVIWLSGFWWRWYSPDRRKRSDERVRRGY